MEFLKVRIDFVGLAGETKPTEDIRNGSTYYTVDTGELYIYYKGEWYLQNPIETTSEESTKKEIQDDTRNEELTPVENGDER